jgi:PTS system nitrogen regulatory IIA component
MLLSDLLHERVVKLNVRSQTKERAIEELIDLIIEAGDLPMSLRAHAIETIHEREKIIGTGMEHGVALPHGSTDRIDSIIGALGIAPAGVNFDSIDGEPATIIVLLLIPRKSFQEHIRAMAAIARVMREEANRTALLAAQSPAEITRIIEEIEERNG